MNTNLKAVKDSVHFFELKQSLVEIDYRLRSIERSMKDVILSTARTSKLRNDTKISAVIQAVTLLFEKYSRPVSLSEIGDYLTISGIDLGKTKRVRISALGAHLRAAIDKPDAKIRRVKRGLYEPINGECK